MRNLTGAAAFNRTGGGRSGKRGKDSGNLHERQQKRQERDDIRKEKRGRDDDISSNLDRPFAKRVKIDENRYVCDNLAPDSGNQEYIMYEVDHSDTIWLCKHEAGPQLSEACNNGWIRLGRHLKEFTMYVCVRVCVCVYVCVYICTSVRAYKCKRGKRIRFGFTGPNSARQRSS